MKKLFLLPVLFLLVLSSCKDEDEPSPQALSEQIKGTWVSAIQEYKYYDEAGQVLFEETDEIVRVYTFDGSNVTSSFSTGGGSSDTYTLSERNGKNYLITMHSGIKSEVELVAISASAMTWSDRVEDTWYNDKDTRAAVSADHLIVTSYFSKK